jgi:hypothetical protein
MKYISLLTACLLLICGFTHADGKLSLGLLSEFNYTDDSRGPSDLDLQRGRLTLGSDLSDEYKANVKLDFTKNATGGFDADVSRAYLTRNLDISIFDKVTLGKFKSKLGVFTTEENYGRNTVSATHHATLYDPVRTGIAVDGTLGFLNLSLNALDHETNGSSVGGDINTNIHNVNLGVSVAHSRTPDTTVVAYYASTSLFGFNLVGEILANDNGVTTTHPYAVDVSRSLCNTINVGVRYSAFIDENDSDAFNITPHVTYTPVDNLKLNVEYDHNDFSNNSANDFQVVRAYLGYKILH